jgi:TonB family protein
VPGYTPRDGWKYQLLPPGSGGGVPEFTPYTVAPELINRIEIGELLKALYPPKLKRAGIGGRTELWALIDEGGHVVRTQVKHGSGYDVLDSAAVRVVGAMVFTPALNGRVPIQVWIQLPVVFKPETAQSRRGARA